MSLNPWVIKDNPLPIDLNAVVYTGAEYVAVGGVIASPSGIYTMRSLTGQAWSQQQNPVNQGGAFSLASGNGTVLAMQKNPGSNSTATVSTDGGKTWTGHLTGISYTDNNARLSRTTDWFIVTGAGGTNGIQRSQNGKTGWVHIPVPLNPILMRANVQNPDGSFSIMIGNDTGTFGNGPNIYKSFDQGLTWAIVASNVGGTNHMYDICHTGSQFVAVGQAGQIMRSQDGDKWTKQFAPVTTNILKSVSGNDNLLMAVGDDQGVGKGPVIVASEDAGETWFEFPMPGLNVGLLSVVVNGFSAVVVGQSNGIQGTIALSAPPVAGFAKQIGDVLIQQTPDDGEINVVGGMVELTSSFETSTYLSLFGGNMSGDWWGNQGIQDQAFKQVSRTQEIIDGMPLTTGNLVKLKEAVEADLKWMMDKSIASNIGVIITIPGLNKVKISIIIKAEGRISEFTFTENWLSK